jgi:hypothetical protein
MRGIMAYPRSEGVDRGPSAHAPTLRLVEQSGTTWVEWVGALGTFATVAAAIGVAAVTFWRRPKLSLHEGREHWHMEQSVLQQAIPYIRLLARNAGLRRSSHGTRVLVEHYRRVGGQRVYLGSPSLGWTSALDQVDSAVVIFPAGERAVDLGVLQDLITDDGNEWCFNLAPNIGIFQGRNVLRADTNGYIIRVVIGSNDGRARRYDVHPELETGEAHHRKRVEHDGLAPLGAGETPQRLGGVAGQALAIRHLRRADSSGLQRT